MSQAPPLSLRSRSVRLSTWEKQNTHPDSAIFGSVAKQNKVGASGQMGRASSQETDISREVHPSHSFPFLLIECLRVGRKPLYKQRSPLGLLCALLRDLVKIFHSAASWLVCHAEGPFSFRFALHKVAHLRKNRNKLQMTKRKTLGEVALPKLLVSLLNVKLASRGSKSLWKKKGDH